MPQARIDRLLEQAVAAGDVPGVVAMATTRDGPLYAGAFGQRGLGNLAPMMPDTVFAIASMTKAITAVAALQLVEAGRLPLDAPLGDLIPELAAPQVLEGFDADGAPRLRPAASPPTLRQLLSHSSGYGYAFWDPLVARAARALGLPERYDGSNRVFATPLLFDPGTRWQYGIGIDIAGKLVEVVTGQRLGAWCAAHVFGPLGMVDTQFGLRADQRRRLADRHWRSADGSLAMTDFAPPVDPPFDAGGGGLFSTAPDYLAFLRHLLQGGDRLLRPETLQELYRNQIGKIVAGRLPASETSHAVEFLPGAGKGWSLGFLCNHADQPGRRGAGSQAWGGLVNTYYWLDPAQGVAGLLMTQILPFADPKVLTLFDAFEEAIYAF
ncbi:MAG TPA: serine hydrolase domain-containing protein [Roseomonas sp.]|jgi:CubicO group peptidase (beta-lactamase class C family)